MSKAPRTCQELGVCQDRPGCGCSKPIRFAPGVVTAYERKTLQRVVAWVARQFGAFKR